MPKNIVVCCDGTENQIDGDATNVLRLWAALPRTPSQLTFYDPGVGTMGHHRSLTKGRKFLQRKLDSAIGLGLRDNVLDAYTFLMRHFEDGDRVFMFGFSRGAYTARAVAGAVHQFGLLHPEHENLAPYLWKSYSEDEATDRRSLFRSGHRFKKWFSRDATIHFMGAWDTVASFGFFTRFRTLPYTRSNPSIKTVRHAVALDERRACFQENLFGPNVPGQDLCERWFPGVHADVGGGYPREESGLSVEPLRWIVQEAIAAGLEMSDTERNLLIDPPVPAPAMTLHNSLSGLWRLVEWVPQRAWNHERKCFAWSGPHRGRKRRPPPDGQS